ncbi:MAG: tRNA threonylcarbamoyladenosine dehydratase [Termitinemataceae bacterium]|nr:MAG: tRNA threonylcarbamoyladenosine dehydratase [Termitinemataceae bacterium]
MKDKKIAPNKIDPAFSRLALITGADFLHNASKTNVIVFGIGGVGSWCAEALVRSGIGFITLVDSDIICITNINRQVQATARTIGRSKTETLKERLLEINPDCNITALTKIFSKETEDDFDITNFDYIIDAIDSLTNKVDLIELCLKNKKTIFSCMGMAQKIDPCKIKTANIWKTNGCPLAKLVRSALRKRSISADFTVVYSEDRLKVQEGISVGCGTGLCMCPEPCGNADSINSNVDWCSKKKIINGSSVTVTASAGMILASLVMQDMITSAAL